MTSALRDRFSGRSYRGRGHRSLITGLLWTAIILGGLPRAQAADLSAEDRPPGIRLRDDTVLSVRVFLPEGDGPFPSLYQATPLPEDRLPSEDDPLISLYNEAGYAFVVVNVRGSGSSQGDFSLLSREEQQDHYEVIQWIATRDWSNGRVAGFGAGYSGSAQWHMAIQAPPALACIAPMNAVLNPYWDWFFPGGLASMETLENWYERELRTPHAYPETGTPRLLTLDLRHTYLAHPFHDDYWDERDSLRHLRQIRVPTFIIHHWAPEQPGLDSSLQALGSLRNLHRTLLLDQAADYIDDPVFHRQELLRFYEWCLRDQDNGFIAGPEIRYQVPGRTLERRERRWPPGDIDFRALNLLPASATLGLEAPETRERASFAARASESDSTLRFLSPPLLEALEITGAARVSLMLESDQVDAGLLIRLYEVPALKRFDASQLPSFLPSSPDEAESQAPREEAPPVLVTQGHLRLSLREPGENTAPEQALVLSANQARWLQPGRSQSISIPMKSTAHRFRRGSRLLLEISAVQDDPALQRWPARLTLDSQPQRPAQLWLPLQQNSARLLEDALSEPDQAPSTPSMSERPALPSFSGSDTESIDYEAALFDSDSLFILLPPPDQGP